MSGRRSTRKRRGAWLAPLGLALALALATGVLRARALVQIPAQEEAHAPLVLGVEAVGMTVADMDRAVEFFSTVLSFEKMSDVEVAGEAYEHIEGVFGLRIRVVRMRLGDEAIELTEYLAPRGRPAAPDSRSQDRWFQHIAIIVRDMDRAYEWLHQRKVEHVSSGPQTLPDWNEEAAGIRAFYFKSPDGDVLEILQFPPGKGDAKWHRPGEALFLGIDHTAIVVADTEASLGFYRDRLGFRVAGQSENYGTEQEHLNNVFGVRLRITSLRAAHGPGVELLEYLSPRDGRPMPADERANDQAHWQTQLTTADADIAATGLRAARVPFVSPGVVALPVASLGFHKGVTVRDPDGHVMRLIER